MTAVHMLYYANMLREEAEEQEEESLPSNSAAAADVIILPWLQCTGLRTRVMVGLTPR